MKIKVFSNDAIQRIASGNEQTQTLISLDVLKDVLKPHQLWNVLGGYGSGGTGTCGFSGNSNHPSEMCWNSRCNISRDDAQTLQGACGGNWCCDSCGQNGYC